MINVKKSTFDRNPFSDEQYIEFSAEINKLYPTSLEIEVILIRKSEETESDVVEHRAILEYDHQCIIEQQAVSAMDILKLVVSMAVSQQDCPHTFVRKKNQAGVEIPTGVGVCLYCGFEQKDVLPKIQGKHVAKHSMSNDVYVTEHDWEGVSIQCGGSGVVIGKSRTYRTAFFEAFPDVNGVSTFIRGEGSDVNEAEAEAWKKYQSRLSCSSHNWIRTVNGSDRTDGYAQCTHCKLTGTVLEPLTKCRVCEKPSKRLMADGSYVCVDHYFAMSNEELVNDHMKMLSEWESNDRLDEEALFHKNKKDSIPRFVSILAKRVIFEELGADYIEQNSSHTSHIGNIFSILCLEHVFGMKRMGRMDKYPEMDEALFKEQLDYLRSNIKYITTALNDKSLPLENGHLIKYNEKVNEHG